MAGLAARERTGGYNLNLTNSYIWWHGYSGMILSRLVPKFRLLSGLESDPNILINCKANSLGKVQLQPILNQLQSAVSEISKLFPKNKNCLVMP